MTSPAAPRSLAALAGFAAAALSSCIFLVDEAGESNAGGGGAGGAASSSTSSSQGGGGEAAGGLGGAGLGGAGGGAGGGAPVACTATLTQVSTGTRQAALVMALGPRGNTNEDVFFLDPDRHVRALRSDLLTPPASPAPPESAGLFLTLLIDPNELTFSPHPLGGVLLANGPVSRIQADGGSQILQDELWGDIDSPMLEAVFAGNFAYGRTLNGGIVDLSSSEPVVPGPIAKLTASDSTLVWATPSGTVAGCTASNCDESTIASSLPPRTGDYIFETLGYAPTLDRYVAFASAGPTVDVYTDRFDPAAGGPTDATLLDEAPFDDAVALAVAGEHVFVLTATELYPCCVGSLLGDQPCGTPVTMPTTGFSRIAAYEGRVVVQKTDTGPYTITSYELQ